MNRSTSDFYLKILDWCILKYGKSQYFDDYPDLEIDDLENGGRFGEVDEDNCILIVYHKVVKSSGDFVKEAIITMIHEYQHYLQNPELLDEYSMRFAVEDDNPLEIEAESVAQRDWKECYNEVMENEINR